MNLLPDATVVRELLTYDPETGSFTWRVNRPKCRQGDVAGSLDKDGYRLIGLLGRQHRAHQLAWLYVHGTPPDGEIDHRNLIRSDNRIDNLRVGTRRQNIANVRLRSTNTSGQKGVYWCTQTGKWRARIRDGRNHRYLGIFDDVALAGAAYAEAARAMYGEYARED